MSKLPLGKMYREARINKSKDLVTRVYVYRTLTNIWQELSEDTEWFEFELREFNMVAIVKRVYSTEIYLMMPGRPLIEVHNVAHAKAIFAALK